MSAFVTAFSASLALLLSGALVRILLKPEIAEKWAALLGRLISRIPGLWRWGNRQYVEHDIQRRVNAFTKSLCEQGPFFAQEEVEIEWVDEHVDVPRLLAENKVVVRLGRDIHPDESFLRATSAFVQQSLLSRLKPAMSQSQATAFDLFVLRRILVAEKPGLLEVFDEEYRPQFAIDKEVTRYYEDFSLIEARGLFWDVTLQELVYLQQKVLGALDEPVLEGEIEDLVSFSRARAARPIGELVNCDHWQDPFRFSLVYVGQAKKIEDDGARVWVEYIQNRLVPLNVESVYLIAHRRNTDVVAEIVNELRANYTKIRDAERVYYVVRSGKQEALNGLVTCLRSTRLVTPAVAGLLRSIEDEAGSRDEAAEAGPRVAVAALEPDPEHATAGASQAETELSNFDGESLAVSVSDLHQEFGFLTASDHDLPEIYFKLADVPDVCLPVYTGQEGIAKVRVFEDRLAAVDGVILEPEDKDWAGIVVKVDHGYGLIRSEGGSVLRFMVKHLVDWHQHPREGDQVVFRPRLTAAGNLRAREIRRFGDQDSRE